MICSVVRRVFFTMILLCRKTTSFAMDYITGSQPNDRRGGDRTSKLVSGIGRPVSDLLLIKMLAKQRNSIYGCQIAGDLTLGAFREILSKSSNNPS